MRLDLRLTVSRVATGAGWGAVALLAALLTVSPVRGGEEKGQPSAGPLPKGQRVFTCAHSFHGFVYRLLDEMAKGAGIQGRPVPPGIAQCC